MLRICRIVGRSLWLALMFLSTGVLPAQTPVWTQLPNSPSLNTRHDDIYMLNETIGWAARGTAGIFKTTNGGNTWFLIKSSTTSYPGTNLLAHFRSISFLTESNGFAGNLGPGSYDTSVRDTNVMYQTFDGGYTWTNVPIFSQAGMEGLCSFHVLDSQTIYGGGRVRGPAYFIKSFDGGTNWTIQDVGTNGLGVMGGIMDVYFRDKTNGFLVGMDTNSFAASCGLTYYGRIARTTDGGATWTTVATTTNSCSYFWKMSWPSATIGYVSLQQNNTPMHGHIFYKTVDGGATWTPNVIPFSAIAPGMVGFYWQSIGFISTNEGFAGGSTESISGNSANTLLRTTNGGASWSPIGYDNSQSINRIRILSPTLAYASGQKIHVFRVPLSIAAPPTNKTVTLGSSATFAVTAYGSVGLAYQWRLGGTNLAGATTNSYSIAHVQPGDAGNYDVVVRDYSGAITSAVATLTVTGVPVAPTIDSQPQSVVVSPGANATFTVSASGTAPLAYQWRFNSTNLSSATNATYTRTNAQLADAGNYSVRVTNIAGNVISADATLSFGFFESFDAYATPSIVTNVGTTNGYKIVFRSASSILDFKAIFGFDYATVTYPTNIPPAPNSVGGTTKGLYLTVNKDATDAAAAVNLYPVGQFFSNSFALKFDMWINWRDIDTSTEHALFGINHSGNLTNRIGQLSSDGLFFAVEGEDDSSPTSTTLRDFSVFRGSGSGMPVLMTTNNTTFGPAPLLAPQFENYNPGFVALFPAKTIPGFGTTPAGSAGLGWVRGEVRQVNDRITWLLNDTIIAQYPNSYAYTNGNILLGYNDNFGSTGDTNNFVVFDNIRVTSVVLAPVRLLEPQRVGNDFKFSFATELYESYTVQWATNLTTPNWFNYTNVLGDGGTNTIEVLLLPGSAAQQYFRVNRP